MADTSKEFEQVLKDLASLRKDVSTLLGDAKDAAMDGVDNAYGQLRRRAKEPVHAVADYVKDQPLTGLLIAFGLGYILSSFGRHR